jgi:KDO2-lipid IV(A) lauroyltransferase
MPYRTQLRVGKGIGVLMYRLMPRRRKIADTNLKMCFPQMDESHRDEIVRKNFQSVAQSGLETAFAWWAPEHKVKPLGHIHGIEHLKDAIATGKPVMVLSAHFTCLEIGSRLMLMEQKYAAMYKPHRNDLLEAVMSRARLRYCDIAIRQDDIRGFLRTLKNKTPVWYAPDQDLGRERSVFAPFFGVPTATVTAPARFAKMTGALLVPYFPKRREDGSGYDIAVLPALEDFPSGDEVADASRINKLIEDHARQALEQYLWLHRRFKTRPEGEPYPYD